MVAPDARRQDARQGHNIDGAVVRLFDPKDGWTIVTRRQFVAELLTAILIVGTLWVMTLFAYGVTPE